MSCVLCESYNVQNEPGYGCALCDVQRYTLHVFKLSDLHRYVELMLWQHVCKQIYLFNRPSKQ